MQPSSSSLKSLLFVVLCACLFSQPSWAGRVVKVKKTKVYIKLSSEEAETFQKGDRLYLTSKSGKKRALVIIRKKKGRKVLAQLKKGKAKKGLYTKAKSSKRKRKRQDDVGYEDASQIAQEEETDSGRPELLFGLMGGYGNATQSVTETNGSFDTTGSSLAVKGLMDYSLFDDLGVRARVGLEMFNVTGTNTSAQTVTTDITYLSIDMLLRYFILNSDSFGLFINGGMGIYSPMSKTSDALDPGSVSTTSILIFGGGASIPIGGMDFYVGADYFYFPPSETVTTNVISAKLGLLFEL